MQKNPTYNIKKESPESNPSIIANHKKKYNDLGFLYVKKDYMQKAKLINNLIGDIIKKSNKILDVGSGNGMIAGYLERWHNKKITKLDPLGTSPDILKIDFLNNPFKDKEFDLIILNGVYDYIEDKEKLLKELNRVGKCVYCSIVPKFPFISQRLDRWSNYKEREKNFLKRVSRYFFLQDITYKALGSRVIYTILKPIIPNRKYLLYPRNLS